MFRLNRYGMKKTLFFFFVVSVSCSALFSQTEKQPRDTIAAFIRKTPPLRTWRDYNPEFGFFQKAFVDKSDPRFMLTTNDGSFKFGIGGFVNVISLCDFNGMVNNKDFVTSQIPVLDKSNQAQFSIGAETSRINFKAVGRTKFGDAIGFIEADFRGSGDNLHLRHAYISYFGFTVGQTWSTFMDLEASPPTIDFEGPNTSIALRQPMIRYSARFSPKWTFSVAMEMNNALIADYPNWGVRTEEQHQPDFPLHVVFKDKFGHLQLGGVLRIMNYYDTIAAKHHRALGYGVALSGRFNLPREVYIYFQAVYGEGIAQYIQDLSFSNLDLVIDLEQKGRLRTLPMYGGYVGIQKDWTKKIYSALIYSYTKLNPSGDYDSFQNMFDHTHYFAANVFWEIIPYGTIGIEYLFGQRVNQSNDRGNANRIDFLVRYSF